MKLNQHIVQHIVKATRPDRLPNDHCSGVFLKHIRKAEVLAVALGATFVLATGCSSTGTGFNARVISPVSTNQRASHSEYDGGYQPSRSPGFNPDLFGG
jgi:hypothetical protein